MGTLPLTLSRACVCVCVCDEKKITLLSSLQQFLHSLQLFQHTYRLSQPITSFYQHVGCFCSVCLSYHSLSKAGEEDTPLRISNLQQTFIYSYRYSYMYTHLHKYTPSLTLPFSRNKKTLGRARRDIYNYR